MKARIPDPQGLECVYNNEGKSAFSGSFGSSFLHCQLWYGKRNSKAVILKSLLDRSLV